MKKILPFILLFMLSFQSRASHLMGGEITWTCQANGQFVFKMILYRDCAGIPIPTGPLSLDVWGNPGLTSIQLPNWTTNDITYCQPTYNCFSPNPPAGATEEGVYTSNPITLNGVPPAGGWVFSWTSCCRNGALDNMVAGGFTMRAVMYPYNGQNVNPCYDGSPAFAERPSTVLCTGFPFTYNHVAIDPEYDSLVYTWGHPLESTVNTPPSPWVIGSNPPLATYNAPYSQFNPLPFNPPNVGATINLNTGEINYACYQAGNYVTCTQVTAYKCGIKVAEIFREIQIVMLGNCPLTVAGTPNAPPLVDPPFQDASGNWTSYTDTVYAGDTVHFFLNAHDYDFVTGPPIAPQMIEVMGFGGQFGAGFTNPNAGCLIPPCATTNPPLPSVGNVIGSSVEFTWVTTCDHVKGLNIGCANFYNTYYFVIRNQDNFCPAPQIAVSTISITVLAPPRIDSSVVRTTAVDSAGPVTIHWAKPRDRKTPNDTAASFYNYQIWRSLSSFGPFVLIDSIFNIDSTSYTDTTVNAQLDTVYYYTSTHFGCDGDRTTGITDTAATMFLLVDTLAPGIAELKWNPVRTPLLSSSLTHYKIYRELPQNVWTFVDSTASLSFIDTVNVGCSDTMNYRVELEDSIGTRSISSIAGVRFSIAPAPDPPSLRCIAVQTNGSQNLTWVAPGDTAIEFDGYFIYHANGAAYTLYDSIFNYSTLTYVDGGLNANSNSVGHYLMTRSACGPAYSIQGDTLKSIYLNVANVAGNASLTWNAMRVPKLPSAGNYYHIYKEYPAGNWALIDSTTSLSYVDTIHICNDTINYRIQLPDASGCFSVSNVDGGRFVDNHVPAAPVIHCLAVSTNGSVTLTWQAPSDTGLDFNSYHIYTSLNAGGPFNILDSIFNYNQTTYIHNGTAANTQSVYYQLRTRTGCGVQYSLASNTARSIFLNVAGANTNVANLTWNAVNTPSLPSSSGNYNIYRKIGPSGAWGLLTTTTSLNYNDTLTICIDSVKYRIEIADNLPCVSISNENGNRFVDNSIPDPPSVRCIAVGTSGDVTLSWLPPLDTAGRFNSYHIYFSTNAGGPFNEIDSIFNYSQTSYNHAVANANTQSVYYYIKTRSGCGVQYSAPSPTIRSIFVNVGGGGTSVANLSWNATHTPLLPSASGTYNIFRKVASGAWGLIASTNSLTFNDSLVLCIDSVKYRIETGDNLPCVSVSNVNGDRFVDNSIPDAPEVRCVSVGANGDITLSWMIPSDTARAYNSYHIYSSLNAGGPFTAIDSIFNYNTSSYTHVGANGNTQSVYYYMETRSGCGVQYSAPSETMQSIFLNVGGAGTSVASLTWNAIHTPNLPTSTGNYRIFKEYPLTVWNQIGTTAGLSYTDTLHLCTDRVNYRVEISDALPCNSVSNVNGAIFVDHTIPAAPEPRCVSVAVNGDVTITWAAPQDTGLDFNSYHVFTSVNANGPYTQIDSIFSYNQTSTVHAGANANNQSVYYVLETRTGCGVEYSPGSDTARSIKLNVTNAGNGVANLNWNHIHSPQFPTAIGTYDVYKEYPANVWNKIATVGENTYKDTITVCSEIINYYVETGDDLPCISTSSRDGDLFQDVIPPAIPIIDTVSVNPFDSLVTITWNVNPSGDTKGYIIYQYNGSTWDSIGATSLINDVSLLNTASLAAQQSETYAVAAFDSCKNLSPLSVEHNTIYLQVALNKCKGAIDLTWVPYENMETGVDHYNVYVSENGGPYDLIGSAPGSKSKYSHAPLTKYATYCYFVQAVSENGLHTSSSNIDCEFADVLQLPTFAYMTKVTVSGYRRVYAECYVDTAADVTAYKLMRSDQAAGPYSLAAVTFDTLNNIVSFTDSAAMTDQQDYYYVVVALSNCGDDVFTSNIGHTIFIASHAQDNLVNRVEWNDYEEWLGKVKHYKLYRSIDDAPIFEEIADVPFGVNTFMDDVSKFYQGDGKFCYYVEAFEGDGNTYGFKEISKSNDGCTIQAPQLYTPNAFTPDGKNPVFLPVNIFTNINGFYFVVFNRWGQKVFESNDSRTGWNGQFNGTVAAEGTYAYYVRIYGNNGEKKEKRGWVNLLR